MVDDPGSHEPCLGLTAVNVLFNDESDDDVGIEQGRRHLIVLERADVFGGDYPTQPHDGQSGRGAVRQRCRPAPPAARDKRDCFACSVESVVRKGDLPGKVVNNSAGR